METLSIRIKLLSLNKYFLVILLGFGLYFGKSQNLIKNSGFENYINPPDWNNTGGSFFDYSFFPEHRIVLDWDIFLSPDYYNTNCPGVYRSVPNNDFGFSYPKEGIAYGGVICFYKPGDTKEYIIQHLTSPLLAGQVYCGSFFVSRADRTTHAIHSLGLYFSVSAPPTNSVYINATPQIVNQNGYITDTIGWTEIKGCFTAQGGEQYVTIGNFNSNINTDTLFVGSTNPHPGANGYAYYYVDSVTLWQNNFPTSIKEYSQDEFVNIYPNPANDFINFKFIDAIEKRKIELYDAIGKLVLTKNATDTNVNLSTSYLQNGIYFYKINIDYKTIKSGKIVVIK